MNMNKKGLSTALTVIIVVVIIVATITIAAWAGTNVSTPASTQGVTVYINDAKQTGNYTQTHPLEWGTVSPGNTYTKNFTVTNNIQQPLKLLLFTQEPYGNTQTWVYNNTQIQPLTTLQGTLTLTLGTSANQGAYTWRLLATNGTTAVNPPPEEEEPETLQCTIKANPNSDALSNLNVTVGGQKIPLFPEDITAQGYTVNFTRGEAIRFQVEASEDYMFVRWDLSNANPSTDNPLLIAEATESFTITVKLMPK